MVLAAMTAEIRRRRKWDEPPALYPIYLKGRSARLGPSLTPGALWHTAPPPEILAALAVAAAAESDVMQRLASPHLFAVGFFCEAWAAVQPLDPGRDFIAQTREFNSTVQAAGGPSKLADREETRYMWAVDRDGFTYSAWQIRGDKTITASADAPGAAYPAEGLVVRSLDRIVAAMTGVPLPRRRRQFT
jgi:hypothetical protein